MDIYTHVVNIIAQELILTDEEKSRLICDGQLRKLNMSSFNFINIIVELEATLTIECSYEMLDKDKFQHLDAFCAAIEEIYKETNP